MFFNEQLNSARSIVAAMMQTNGGLNERCQIASRTNRKHKSRDPPAGYLRLVNHISDPLNLTPFLQLDAQIYFRLLADNLFTKDLAHVYYPQAADLEEITRQLGCLSDKHIVVDNNIDRVIRDEPMAFCDEVEGAFGFPDSGLTKQKDSGVEHADQYAMQLTFPGAGFCLRFG